jgi:ferredoxin
MEHELAHMFEHYFVESGAQIMKYNPAFHRTAPVQSGPHMEWILPYDHVRRILENSKSFHVRDCICRLQQKHIGKGCDKPLHVCMAFTPEENSFRDGAVSREEALSILDLTKQAGLVHSLSNVREGMNYMCNCCGCCCTLLRGLRKFGLKGGIAAANYYAEHDPSKCTGCGICVERCQTGAIEMTPEGITVDTNLCIGCGLCTTTCPVDAICLAMKPSSEIIHPPFDYSEWEDTRRKNRKKTYG